MKTYNPMAPQFIKIRLHKRLPLILILSQINPVKSITMMLKLRSDIDVPVAIKQLMIPDHAVTLSLQ
jgi:hypothetical protein